MKQIETLQFINPNKNDKFSNLRGLDLQELIVQIENFYLIYRDSLNLPKTVSFGVEIEYEGRIRKSVDDYISENFDEWWSKSDGSLDSGGEISSPVLHDEIKTWKELQSICNYLKKKKANTFDMAGGHIHIGAHTLGDNVDNWKKFIKVYTSYENIIFRFAYGDKISARKRLFYYARPIVNELNNAIDILGNLEIKKIYSLHQILPTTQKRQALNFLNVLFYYIDTTDSKNTLEFRCPNATIEEVVWQNNINAFSKLVLAPSKGLIDEEFVDYKLKHERVFLDYDLYMYNEVCLKNALEFVDQIFDNNLDKVYFLKQYIKGFQSNFGLKHAVKSKKFIK